jgi:hypothetical protein
LGRSAEAGHFDLDTLVQADAGQQGDHRADRAAESTHASEVKADTLVHVKVGPADGTENLHRFGVTELGSFEADGQGAAGIGREFDAFPDWAIQG